LLAHWTAATDIAVGTPIAGRNRAELEDLIGFFVNTLVLRADLSGDPTFAELLDQVKATTLDAYANQDLPFDRLVEDLAPHRDPARNPLFNTMFAVEDAEGDGWRFPGARFSAAELGIRTAKFDLSAFLAEEEDGSLSAEIVYPRDVFEAGTVARLAAR